MTDAPTPNPDGYDAEQVAVATLICPRCEARPGDGCESLSGAKAKTHTSRYQPLLDAYEAGRRAGHIAATGAVGIA